MKKIQGLINFINTNTWMNSFPVSFIKFLLIIVPLYIGLFTYSYLSVDFCKSLFLYSSTLTFDMGIKFHNINTSKNSEILLFIANIVLFITSAILLAISFIGITDNKLISNCKFFIEHQEVIRLFIFSQAFWYLVETFLLIMSGFLRKILKKPISVGKISQDSDDEFNL